MIRHFFRVIWFRKKENFMTSLGIFISFIVLFLVASFLVYTIGNYFKPLGFEYKNVWKITMDWKDDSIEEKIETFRQVENVLNSITVQFSFCASSNSFFSSNLPRPFRLKSGRINISLSAMCLFAPSFWKYKIT